MNHVDAATAGHKEVPMALNVYITKGASSHISDSSLDLKKLEESKWTQNKQKKEKIKSKNQWNYKEEKYRKSMEENGSLRRSIKMINHSPDWIRIRREETSWYQERKRGLFHGSFRYWWDKKKYEKSPTYTLNGLCEIDKLLKT